MSQPLVSNETLAYFAQREEQAEAQRVAKERFTRAVDAALEAHWPSLDRMRADHSRKWRTKMEAAVAAALKSYLP